MIRRTMLGFMAIAFCVIGVARHSVFAMPSFGKDSQMIPGGRIVTGTVNYKERVDLPQTAMVHVELIDMSAKDPRKALLGEDTIWPAGIRLPVTFRIAYDPSRIDPTRIYTVRARIMDGEKTLFVSSSMSQVLTKGASDKIDIVVVPVSIRY